METILIPSSRQAFWGKLAVANFFLGGTGAGAYAVAAALSGFERTPLLLSASALGPLLVAAGFLAVALEAGRPFRGLSVLRRLATSWMSRELLFGSIFLLMAPLEFVTPLHAFRVVAAVAAVLLMLAQGFILVGAKGVASWSAPVLPALFLASGLVAGAALLMVAQPAAWSLGWGAAGGAGDQRWGAAGGVGDGGAGLALGAAWLVVSSALLWIAYLVWPGGPAFRRAGYPRLRRGWPLRSDNGLLGIFVIGHLLPLFILILGFRMSAVTSLAATLSGIGVLAGQLQGKAWLVLRAGMLRPITISSLTPHPSLSPSRGEEQGDFSLPSPPPGGRG